MNKIRNISNFLNQDIWSIFIKDARFIYKIQILDHRTTEECQLYLDRTRSQTFDSPERRTFKESLECKLAETDLCTLSINSCMIK